MCGEGEKKKVRLWGGWLLPILSYLGNGRDEAAHPAPKLKLLSPPASVEPHIQNQKHTIQ